MASRPSQPCLVGPRLPAAPTSSAGSGWHHCWSYVDSSWWKGTPPLATPTTCRSGPSTSSPRGLGLVLAPLQPWWWLHPSPSTRNVPTNLRWPHNVERAWSLHQWIPDTRTSPPTPHRHSPSRTRLRTRKVADRPCHCFSAGNVTTSLGKPRQHIRPRRVPDTGALLTGGAAFFGGTSQKSLKTRAPRHSWTKPSSGNHSGTILEATLAHPPHAARPSGPNRGNRKTYTPTKSLQLRGGSLAPAPGWRAWPRTGAPPSNKQCRGLRWTGCCAGAPRRTIPGTADTYQFAAGSGDRRNPSNSARPNSETTSPPNSIAHQLTGIPTPGTNPPQPARSSSTAKRGSAPGLSGAMAEHYKVVLDDEEGLSLFTATLELLAQGQVPEAAMATLSTARLTALSKPNGGVRGIATGEVLRRLASRVLARQYAEIFDAATRPFQYALRTRAGTDCLAAILRTAAELDESATIVSLDGRAAYDTVSRAAMFHKLFEVAPALVPFVRGIYGRTSVYPDIHFEGLNLWNLKWGVFLVKWPFRWFIPHFAGISPANKSLLILLCTFWLTYGFCFQICVFRSCMCLQ